MRLPEWDRSKSPSGCFDGCVSVFVGLFVVAALLLLACGGLGI